MLINVMLIKKHVRGKLEARYACVHFYFKNLITNFYSLNIYIA